MDANSALQYSDPATAAMNSGNGLPAPVQQARARLQSDVTSEQKEMQPQVDKMKELAATPHPTQPTLQKSPTAPSAQDFSKDGQAWIGALAAMSALVGARGRGRGTAALKAYAAGLKGVQTGNQQAFENSYKEWQANTKAIMDDNKTELDKFKAVMDDRSLSESEAKDAISAIAAEHQDSMMIDAKDYEQQMKLYDIRVQHQDRLEELTDKVKAKADELIAKQNADKDASDKAYGDWKKTASAKKDAESWNEGLPVSGFIRGRGKDAEQQLEFVKKYAAELDPDGDRAKATEDYNAANKAISSFGSGKQGDIVRSFNVAYNHADLVGQLADALGNGDVQRINSVSQKYEQEFGSPAPTNFDAAKHILADEVNKAAIGGAGALADRQALTANILRASSPEQIKGQLQTYKTLIIGQMKGMKQQYEQATKRDDFDRLLSPEVRDDLKNHSDQAAAATYDAPDFSYIWNGKD